MKWRGDDVRSSSLTRILDQIFFKTLCSFPNIAIYANAVHDRSSPYATSAIELEDPFLEYEHNGLEMCVNANSERLSAALC